MEEKVIDLWGNVDLKIHVVRWHQYPFTKPWSDKSAPSGDAIGELYEWLENEDGYSGVNYESF